MASRAAQGIDFLRLPEQDRERYAAVLDTLDRLKLGCRCEMVDGKDFTITVGKGYATARFWLEHFQVG